MYNNLFTIGTLTVHTYGVMTAIGILAAYFTAEYRAKKQGLDDSKIFWLVIWCLIFGYLGSKILYFITIAPQIAEDPSVMLRSLADGWVVYGGIIGGILGGFLFCRRHKLPALKFFDLGLTSVALAQGFGRLGCFFAGCCYGQETDSAFSITFTNSDFAPNGVALIPTQLISSTLDFLLFLFLLLMHRRRKNKAGQCTALYLICYGIGRFILEFFRGDLIRGSVGTISTSQFISIFIVLAGVILFVLVSRTKEMEIKACVFDLDGTLLSTLESIANPTNQALKEFGFQEMPVENYKSYVGDGYRICVERALKAAGDEKLEKLDEVYDFGKKLYDVSPMYKTEAFSGIVEAIGSLKKAGIKLAVLTNKPHVSAQKVVEHFFGTETFDLIQGQEDGKPIKPDKACIQKVLDALGVEPKECIYFGDSNTDMKTGKNAGIFTVGVAWGYRSKRELFDNRADLVIDSPKKITEVCKVWESIQRNA